MNFLFPGFLFALAAVAIPVIIHLFNFRKFKKVYFSNVQFLKSVEQQTSSTQKIKNRLILAARMLAVIFIVLAFSKPYIPDRKNAVAGQEQAVSIYIDNSYSMETVNKEGTLLDEAKRRAKEIASAYSLNDKFQLLTNDFEGVHQRFLSYDQFEEAVDEVQISANNRVLSQIVSRQSDIFRTEPKARKVIYLISDFQKNILSKTPLNPDTAIAVRLIQLKSNSLPNISIDSVWFTSPVHRPGQTERLVVRLKNNSGEAAKSVPLRLTINNQQKALGSLTIPPRGTSSDTMSFSGLRAGWQQGQISITDYPVTFDDQFYFSFKVHNNLPLLAVNGDGINPYLDAVYRSDAFFYLENTLAGKVNYSRLSSYPLIILNEIPDISAGLSQSINSYVRNGGSLLIFPSLTSDLNSLKTFLQVLGTDVPEEVVTAEVKTSINLQHPVFEGVFEQIPRNMELPVGKKYLRYTTRSTAARRSIIDLPGRRTFFAEYSSGQGKVYLSAVPLTEEASNLVRHSVFVPLMYQTALLSLKRQHLFYILGRDQLLETERITLNSTQALKISRDDFEAIPDVRQTATGTSIYFADQIRENGNYQLTLGDSLLAVFALNDNRTESDLSYASAEELSNQFSGKKAEVFEPVSGSIKNAIQSANFGIQLWKLCLILALLFLAAEIFLIRFYRKIQSQ